VYSVPEFTSARAIILTVLVTLTPSFLLALRRKQKVRSAR
jgi:hypothetical protein